MKRRTAMNREKIYKEMEGMFGLVPSFFKLVPDSSLEHEWELFKTIQLNETAIPNKYKELIGVGISAAVRCRYCSLFHTEMAKLNGATDEEIEEAVHYAKSSAGWSTYLNGMQVDYDQFKEELRQVCEHVKANMPAAKECTSYGDWTCKEEEVETSVSAI
jgi:AhpD family alkylhydroperoxidase